MHRRTFLKGASLLPLGALTGLGCNRKPDAATQPIPVGLQLYTLREQLTQDLEGTLAKVRAIGYQRLEFAGYYDRSPAQIRELLTRHGCVAPAAHVRMPELRTALSQAVETAQAIGHQLVVCPSVDKDQRETLAQFHAHAELLNRASEAFQRAGITFAYHNHDYEFTPVEGKLPFELLLAETDPSRVKLELDVYWLVRAKQDPVKLIQEHAGRVVALHVKDMNKSTEDFAAVGQGRIDYQPILRAARAARVEHYYVEQDRCEGSPLDQIKLSYDYLSHVTV